MIKFGDIMNNSARVHNTNWPQFPDHFREYKLLGFRIYFFVECDISLT